MSSSKNTERHHAVIVRAYKDEPVRLKMLSMRNEVVEVTGDNESLSLGFTSDVVYPFDEDLFTRLRGAYEIGDDRALVQLWREARSYRSLSLR